MLLLRLGMCLNSLERTARRPFRLADYVRVGFENCDSARFREHGLAHLLLPPKRERRANRHAIGSPPGTCRLALTLDVQQLSDFKYRRQDAGSRPQPDDRHEVSGSSMNFRHDETSDRGKRRRDNNEVQCLPLFACQIRGIDRYDDLASKRSRRIEVGGHGDDTIHRGSGGGLD